MKELKFEEHSLRQKLGMTYIAFTNIIKNGKSIIENIVYMCLSKNGEIFLILSIFVLK